MRTARVKIYKFSELSATAKTTAINDYRNAGIDNQHYWQEAHESVKAIHEALGTKEGGRSWLEVKTGSIPELETADLFDYLIENLPKDRNCPFTGCFYDNILLAPFYAFIDKPSTDELKDLIEHGLESLRTALNQEDEYNYSDAAITENIISNNYEFTADGKRF